MRPLAAPLLALASLASGPALAQSPWSTAPPLSQARTNVAGVAAGDLAFFAGGNEGSTHFDDVDIYDASMGAPSDPAAWSTATLTAARTQVGATEVDGLVLFAGGRGATPAAQGVIDVYDLQSGNWSTATLPHPRFGVAATTLGKKAFFAGGTLLGSGVQDTVDIYDATLGAPSNPAAWSMATLIQARADICAVSVGTQVVFAGGSGPPQGTPSDRVDIYDGLTGRWTDTTLAVARLMGPNAGAVVGTRAYFGGGHFSFQGGPDMSDAVDIYDASTGDWEQATLSLARGYVGVTAVGNTVLFAGGAGTSFVFSDVVDTLNVGTGRWEATHALSQPRGTIAAVTLGDTALFASGGIGGAGLGSAVVDVYEPLGVSYCVATPNSTGQAATISAIGSSSLAANDLVLTAVGLPDKTYIFIHGGSQAELPFFNGFLCVGTGVRRIQPAGVAVGGVAMVKVDLPAPGITAPGVRHFQCLYRDLAGGGAGTNLSDAIEVTFVP